MLAALGGNNSPLAADIEKILSSVGIESEKDKVSKVISELKGKNLEDVIAEGTKKLASVPSGGGDGGGGAAPAAAAAGGAVKAEAKAEKKEEKKEV